MSNKKEKTAWRGMKRRCYDPSFNSYKNYGARGILVCERWINSFDNFIQDMGLAPSSKHSIDRIDNNIRGICPYIWKLEYIITTELRRLTLTG